MNMAYGEHESLAIEDARKRLSTILGVLRGAGAFWHRTTIANLRAILEHGAIEPNLGQFAVTYPQSNSCYGRQISAVSLFDFDSEPIEGIYLSHNWPPFLLDCWPVTILICIDRRSLDSEKLILPPAVRHPNMPHVEPEDGEPYVPCFIPRVEAWHRGPIPVSSFRRYLAIRSNTNFEYEEFAADHSQLERIEIFCEEWQAELDRDRAARRARGELDLAEALEEARARGKAKSA